MMTAADLDELFNDNKKAAWKRTKHKHYPYQFSDFSIIQENWNINIYLRFKLVK
jgi:hypothetical protein